MNKGIHSLSELNVREQDNSVSLCQYLFSRQISRDLFDSMQTCSICEPSHPRLLVSMLGPKPMVLQETTLRKIIEMSVSTCQ